MRVKKKSFYEKILLIAVFIFSCNEVLGLNIYSALPDHIIEWLKRHIFVEISNVNSHTSNHYLKDQSENTQTCNSINGPYCKYLSNFSNTYQFDLDASKYIYDHEGGIGYFNKDFFMGKSIYNMFLISELTTQNEMNNITPEVKKVSRTKSDDTTTIQKHCKLTRKSLIYCIKIIFKSYYTNAIQKFTQINFVSKFIDSWRSFLNLTINNKLFKILKNNSNRRFNRLRNHRRSQIYTIIDKYNLPQLHSDFLDQKGNYLQISKDDQSQLKFTGELYTNTIHFQTKSNILFDETLSKFLKSKYVRINLINSLTWILQQKSPYSDIWQNWRNEKLSKHYIILDHPESYHCDQFSVSPYNGAKICSNLLTDDFQSKFRVIRKAWNGVSSKMNFSILKPNVRILPSQFSSDEMLSCNWQGFWETYQDKVLNIKLNSRFGKFEVYNEKIVLSNLPISLCNNFLNSQKNKNMDELKTITILGYNHSKLMWKSTIPINKFISNNSNQMKWLNALDYSDINPYSPINIIQFETDFLMDSMEQWIIVGQFEYNILNPIFNYIPRNEEMYENLSVEIGQVAELGLVIYMNDHERMKDNIIPSLSMTTMYVSKASPFVSIYNIENNRLNLKYKVNESTLSVIKRNMVELTKDQ